MKMHPKVYHYLYYHFPWQFFMTVIFMLSSISQQNMPGFVEKFSDKFLHFVVFGVLAVLIWHSIINSRINYLHQKAAAAAIIFTSVYGIIDELHQILVPGRICSTMDWLADTLGALFFVVIINYFWRKKTDRNKIYSNGGQKEPVTSRDVK